MVIGCTLYTYVTPYNKRKENVYAVKQNLPRFINKYWSSGNLTSWIHPLNPEPQSWLCSNIPPVWLNPHDICNALTC